MPIAPEPVLRAGNEVVYQACVYCRSVALDGTAIPQMIAELMDAIHDVPRALVNWQSDYSIDVLRSHLGTVSAKKWPGMPNLVAIFDSKLQEYSRNAA
jgi:hypothetical protein